MEKVEEIRVYKKGILIQVLFIGKNGKTGLLDLREVY